MEALALAQEHQLDKAEWLVFSEAVLRVADFASLDELLHVALNSWLQQLSPQLRWKIACDLYTSQQVSSGRAAEIAGLNYFVFEEKLHEKGFEFYAAHSTTETQIQKRKALIHAGFKFTKS